MRFIFSLGISCLGIHVGIHGLGIMFGFHISGSEFCLGIEVRYEGSGM